MKELALCVVILASSPVLAQVEPDLPRAVVQYVTPRFPESQRSKVTSAKVVLELVISANGSVSNAKVSVSGGEDFDAAALEAIRGSTFAPGKKQTRQTFTVSFQLN